MNLGLASHASLVARENFNKNNTLLNNSLEKLSTGLRINKASDDAIGLAISDKLRFQSTGVKQGIDNANSAISMMQIADKSINELSKILDTIKGKAIQMNTDTTSEEGRKAIKNDILALIENYDNIVCSTNYNKTTLLNGCATPFVFQVADKSNDLVKVNIDNIESSQMGNDEPFRLKNFITGFTPFAPPVIGDANGGVILSNDLTNRVGYGSNPAGNFMIEVPAGIKNFTVHLDDYGANDTIPIFTKDGTHVAGTRAGHSSWDAPNGPAEILNLFPDKFNAGASYTDDLSRYALNSPKDSLGDSNVNWIDKSGNSQIYNLGFNDEMVVIPNVTENLVIFINGNGAYDVAAEWRDNTLDADDDSCGCDDLELERNDENPNLKTQAQILMDIVDKALSQLNAQRGSIGAGVNQIEGAVRNNMSNYVKLRASESTLRDLDYASESANFNKLDIQSKAGSFALSQTSNLKANLLMQLLQ